MNGDAGQTMKESALPYGIREGTIVQTIDPKTDSLSTCCLRSTKQIANYSYLAHLKALIQWSTFRCVLSVQEWIRERTDISWNQKPRSSDRDPGFPCQRATIHVPSSEPISLVAAQGDALWQQAKNKDHGISTVTRHRLMSGHLPCEVGAFPSPSIGAAKTIARNIASSQVLIPARN